MSIKKAVLGLMLGAATTMTVAVDVAVAADKLYMPALVYRTGAYAPGGVPFANGFKDFVTLLNERDGGIGGVPIEYEECEFGYNTKVAIECYEKVKGKKPMATLVL